ncbi:hypothetical protein PR048_013701 [Dryococelus australis]|uniref:Uncharacterized protein n=1 Tax=Dryococelus australis TaxID=614101 RepID=A0ABQ9HT23_9NEOP|nr:hypothetical protein PR048_013701 [Dryococelus australis]
MPRIILGSSSRNLRFISWLRGSLLIPQYIKAETKVAILLHTIGAEMLEIYNTFSLSEEDSCDNVKILDILEQHFIQTANETVVRCDFFTRVQQEGGKFGYVCNRITEIKCCFDLQDSLIRDRIICGLRVVRVKDRLLREPNLDLLKYINISHYAELAEIQTRQLEGKNFGYTPPSNESFTRSPSTSFEFYDDSGLNTRDIHFKLVTGAQVNIITKDICILFQLDIVPTQFKLLNYNGGRIDAIGEMTTTVVVNGSEYTITFVVVDIKAT